MPGRRGTAEHRTPAGASQQRPRSPLLRARLAFRSQDRIERSVDVIVGAAGFLLLQQTTRRQFFQVSTGREPGYAQVALDELDLRVRVCEQVIDQVLAVETI